MTKKRRVKRKIKYKNLLLFLSLCFVISYIIFYIVNTKLKNIYITGNTFLNDQYIIDLAGISNYPSIFKFTTSGIEKKLEKNVYILKADVNREKVFEIHIDVVENRPLFYYLNNNKTVLMNEEEVDDVFDTPTVINYIPDTIYKDFVKCMSKLDNDVLSRISEIKYDPNDVDDERFLFTMSDGNYVYINIINFSKIDDYLNIISKFNGERGTLFLDSGEYFKKMD